MEANCHITRDLAHESRSSTEVDKPVHPTSRDGPKRKQNLGLLCLHYEHSPEMFPECANQRFENLSRSREHTREKHLGNGVLCSTCGDFFPSGKYLHRHKTKKNSPLCSELARERGEDGVAARVQQWEQCPYAGLASEMISGNRYHQCELSLEEIKIRLFEWCAEDGSYHGCSPQMHHRYGSGEASLETSPSDFVFHDSTPSADWIEYYPSSTGMHTDLGSDPPFQESDHVTPGPTATYDGRCFHHQSLQHASSLDTSGSTLSIAPASLYHAYDASRCRSDNSPEYIAWLSNL